MPPCVDFLPNSAACWPCRMRAPTWPCSSRTASRRSGSASLCEVWGEPDHPEDGTPGLRLRASARRARAGCTGRSGFDLHVEHGLEADRGRRPDLPRAARATSSTTTRRVLEALAAADARGALHLRALLRRVRARRGRPARRPRVHHPLAAHRRARPSCTREAQVDPDVLYVHDGTIAHQRRLGRRHRRRRLHLMRQQFGARRRRRRRPADGRAAAPRRRPGPVHRPRRARLRRRDPRPAAGVDRRDTSTRTSTSRAGPARRTCRRAPSPAGSAPRPAPRRTPGSPASGCWRAEELLELTDHSVDWIADEVGFGNAATLRHHFTRVRGRQPAAVPPDLRRPHRLLGGRGQLAPPRSEGGVPAAAGDQLVVRAVLDDPAAVEHRDLVGVAHGGQPVRDGDRRPARGWPRRAPPARPARSRCPARWSPRRAPAPRGSRSSVRAIASRCFSPPENRCPRAPTTVS